MYMSRILRSAESALKSGVTRAPKAWKSGSEWEQEDLEKYSITIQRQSPRQFFGFIPTELPQVGQAFLTSTLATKELSYSCFQLHQYLELASEPEVRETAIDDFAREILRAVEFEERGVVLRARHVIPLSMSGEGTTSARTNICLFHGNMEMVLLLQQNKTDASSRDPEPQLIAEAIAAFQANNLARTKAHLSELDRMTIPCLTMVGTRPTFYKIPITKALSDAVTDDTSPQKTTRVTKCLVTTSCRLGVWRGS
ncbi:hypothetical protein BS47DRAFT_1375764 [Hydnum rufescens UP504]|uniref:Uncharacterized protein n=1 Tax=Hydnum rufescens UP504 TaxID=1448309 RepID=A0A9P6B3Y9_9AGAM|nr:hypothetical protein BS47DRAFT_1375764 [Hydnum rufescens UP504]